MVFVFEVIEIKKEKKKKRESGVALGSFFTNSVSFKSYQSLHLQNLKGYMAFLKLSLCVVKKMLIQ